MLFDLRSPHRRRVIKIVYVFLAVLIGGGLIFFGVGTGNNSGGLLTNVGGGGGTASGDKTYEQALATAEKKANASPSNPAVWVAVGRAAYNVATLPANYESTLGFTKTGHAELVKLKQAWTRYQALAPSKPNVVFAEEVSTAFSAPPTGIGDYPTAESAQEIVAENNPTSYQAYEYLSYYAYLAHETSQADVAAAKAVALAPKKDKKQVEAALAAVRSAEVGSTSATGSTSSTATSSSTTASGATGTTATSGTTGTSGSTGG